MGLIVRGPKDINRDILSCVDEKAVFGQNVRRLRQARGLSQEALASRAGMDRSYLGSVERGKRNISLQGMVTIARALDVSVSELVASLPPGRCPPSE